MSNVIDFHAKGWLNGHVKCRECLHTWVCTYPNGTDEDALECPQCRKRTGMVIAWIGLGEDRFERIARVLRGPWKGRPTVSGTWWVVRREE